LLPLYELSVEITVALRDLDDQIDPKAVA